MIRYVLPLIVLSSFAAFAEEFARAQQFKLADGRTVQAARMIKISARGKTTFLITLVDGRKMSLDADDVSSISDVQLPVAMLPKVSDESLKSAEVATGMESAVARAGTAVVKISEKSPGAQTPVSPLPPEYTNDEPVRYVRRYYYNQPEYERPSPTPPPPPAPVSQTPARELTSSDIARRAFTTVPSFQAFPARK